MPFAEAVERHISSSVVHQRHCYAGDRDARDAAQHYAGRAVRRLDESEGVSSHMLVYGTGEGRVRHLHRR